MTIKPPVCTAVYQMVGSRLLRSISRPGGPHNSSCTTAGPAFVVTVPETRRGESLQHHHLRNHRLTKVGNTFRALRVCNLCWAACTGTITCPRRSRRPLLTPFEKHVCGFARERPCKRLPPVAPDYRHRARSSSCPYTAAYVVL